MTFALVVVENQSGRGSAPRLFEPNEKVPAGITVRSLESMVGTLSYTLVPERVAIYA